MTVHYILIFLAGSLAALGALVILAFVGITRGWFDDERPVARDETLEGFHKSRLAATAKTKAMAVEALLRSGSKCQRHRWPGRIRR